MFLGLHSLHNNSALSVTLSLPTHPRTSISHKMGWMLTINLCFLNYSASAEYETVRNCTVPWHVISHHIYMVFLYNCAKLAERGTPSLALFRFRQVLWCSESEQSACAWLIQPGMKNWNWECNKILGVPSRPFPSPPSPSLPLLCLPVPFLPFPPFPYPLPFPYK